MAGYLFVCASNTDGERLQPYLARVGGVIARYGGRLLCRGMPDVLEGSWSGDGVVILEFPDRATARQFYASPEYAELKAIRAGAVTFQMLALGD